MYIDPSGREHPWVHLLMEDTKEYLKGWYFEDETGCFASDGPFGTLEETEHALSAYSRLLNA